MLKTTTASAAAPAPLPCAPRTPPTRRRLPWAPTAAGRYRLPREIEGRLVVALAPLKNRDACFALASFLGRYHSAPGRLERPLVVCRQALADHPDLGLSEARVRGALAALESLGFLTREPMPGSPYRATAEGLKRKPVAFRFGPEWMPDFRKANRRAERARGGVQASRRVIAPANRSTPPAASLSHPVRSEHQVARRDPSGGNRVYYGEERSTRSAVEPNPNLEAALERLWKGCRGAAGGLDGEPR